MKVNLIYPNFKSGNAGGTQEPLGIISVASVLRQRGHEVSLTDMTFQKELSVIEEPLRKADVVGIGCTTPLFGRALEILKWAKRIKPSVFFMTGGPHATNDPKDALMQGFDAVVMGEAEKTVVDLVDYLADGSEWRYLSGLAYLEGNEVVETPRAEFIADLDDLPFVARDLIDQKRYLKRNGFVSIINTRGCPFNCLYCKPMQMKLFGRKCRRRTAGNVAEEIEAMHKDYGANNFRFQDDTMLLCGREWFEELKTEFDRRKLHVKLYCNGRVDQVDNPLLKSMKAAGVEAIAFGVESGSQKILDFYRKGTTPDQARKAFSLCHNLKIMTHAFIMLGAPDETVDDLQNTLDLFKEIRPYSYRSYIVTPFPGNFLYEYSKEKGIFDVQSYKEYDNALNLARGKLPMKLKHLTIEDILKYSKKLRRAYFLGNVVRCLTRWSDMKMALKNSLIFVNIVLRRF